MYGGLCREVHESRDSNVDDPNPSLWGDSGWILPNTSYIGMWGDSGWVLPNTSYIGMWGDSGWVLPNTSYIGMCDVKGCRFGLK